MNTNLRTCNKGLRKQFLFKLLQANPFNSKSTSLGKTLAPAPWIPTGLSLRTGNKIQASKTSQGWNNQGLNFKHGPRGIYHKEPIERVKGGDRIFLKSS